MEGFDGLSSAFNVENEEEFVHAVEEVQQDMEMIEAKKNEIAQKINFPVMFEDQGFIQRELKSLIMSARTVMTKVEQDIKIGCPPRQVEVYAKLVESIGKQYTSLLDLNKTVFEAAVEAKQVDINNIGNNKISLTSEQLLDMINGAKENSQMNAIDADFEVEDEHLPQKRERRENPDA